MKAILALGTSLMLTAGWLAKTYSAPPVPDDLLILRCQPAVFKVEELGSPEVMHPSAYVRMDILEAQDRQNPDLDLAKANRL
jgi:hypothetical protein